MNINKIKFSIITSISLISVAIITSFGGCGYDQECCSLTKSPTAVISGFTSEQPMIINTAVGVPIFLSVSGTSSYDDGNITSYEWFVNGTSVAKTMIGNLEVNPGLNEICLLVTDDENRTNKTCQDVTFKRPDAVVIEPDPTPTLTCRQKPTEQHADPTPLLTLTNETDGGVIVTDNILEKPKRYSLSCAGSLDDCGDETDTCQWAATSYMLDINGTKTIYVENCFDDAEHLGHGAEFTTGDIPSYIELCGGEAFNRVEVSLTVVDDYNRTNTITEIYTVAP